jgi:glycosyltransferase involved in cell wall biosynthesis
VRKLRSTNPPISVEEKVRKLSFLFLPEYFYPYVGGGENWFLQIGRQLVKRGHRVVVYALAMPGVLKEETLDGLLIRRFGYPFVISGWQPYLRRFLTHVILLFNLLLMKESFDLVVGQGSPLLFGRMYSAIHNVPIVSVVHDVYGLDFSIASKGVAKGVARHVVIERVLPRLGFDLWIAVSKTTARKLIGVGVVPDKIRLVYNGINPEEYSLVRRARRPQRICYVGRLVDHKHVEDLIEVFCRLKKDYPALELYIVGDGDKRQKLDEYARKTQVQNVVFTGFVSKTEKDRIMSSSLCLVLPSIAEGWSVVLTEAAAFGVASIAYATPAVVEQASMIPSIITIPQRDTKSLESALRRMVSNPEDALLLGEKGRNAALAFTWEKSAEGLLSHISALVGRGLGDQ